MTGTGRAGRQRGGSGTVVVLLALALAGCTVRPMATPQPGMGPQPLPAPPPTGAEPIGASDSPTRLPGWDLEDHRAAFDAFLAGCRVSREAAMRAQCDRAMELQRTSRPVAGAMARRFFETGFAVVEVRAESGSAGLLTAYFAPEYPARRRPSAEFDAPVRPTPADWTDGQILPTRAEIEAGSAADALAWMRAEDLFFLQIQGSGYLTFEDGSRARASYAANNGRVFAGIARPMAEQGLLPRDGTSGEAIRAWLAEHRGGEADRVMALNPRYIFFTLDPDDGGDPPGAAGAPLVAGRSIAVDPAHWRYGDLVWIEAEAGSLRGARRGYRGLVMALDTGSAIRGPVRADLYLGRGEAAGAEAGSVRHPLRMWRLVPRR